MPTTDPTANPYYYVDGFHGGVDGHFPLGTLRDILNGLDAHLDWKVTFEIEPYTWAIVEQNDPASIARLRRLLADHSPAARVELVSGVYGQSYLWNVTGESVIRHLRYGRAAIAAVFPDALVDSYAVQEPCWTSCLPGLLRSFGYRRVSLVNSTCWGGYHAGRVNADLCQWVGPDGTSIPAVPRYGVDGLIGPATEENAELPDGYTARCHAARIAHPVGAILQDAGWPGKPWGPGHSYPHERPRPPVQHVTWREYVDTIAEPAEQRWPASLEDLRVGLPWGATILQRIAQVCRAGEIEVAQAEKLCAMASMRAGTAYPGDDLRSLWIDVLLSQHHDVWIVPFNRNNVGTWASECDARYAHGHKRCIALMRAASAAMCAGSPAADETRRHVRLFNSAGFDRRDVAAVDVVADPGTVGFRVRDSIGNEVVCQPLVRRKFPGGATAAATLLFPAHLPAMGYATYTVVPVVGTTPGELLAPTTRGSGATVTVGPDGAVLLETDLYRLTLDPTRGGTVRSLIARDGGDREFVDQSSQRAFNEYRGFFGDEAGTGGAWLSSAASPATIETIEAGPVRVSVRIRGHIGPHGFTAQLSAAQGQRRIDVNVTFDFPIDGLPFESVKRPQRARIGEPWPAGQDATRSDRRPFYDGSYKLQALFPAAVGQSPVLHKNGPFDACRSEHADTRFDRWSTLKHNVAVNWVDVSSNDGSVGLSVLIDHTTAYAFGGGEPFGVVLGYAGQGLWANCPIGRAIRVSYGLLPHAGDMAAAQLWREVARWSEPIVSQVMAGPPLPGDERWSMVDATDAQLDVTAVERMTDRSTHVRLFNGDGAGGDKRIGLPLGTKSAQLVELDGRRIADLPITSGVRPAVTVDVPRFGVRTVRLA